MGQTSIPQGYSPLLSIYETQKAIGLLKRLFEDRLSGALRLHRVSAPLFVAASSGLNDDLNGVERPVSFDIRGVNDPAVVVHSLAKWKRLALKRYQFHPGEGLYTDMNAIRRDEDLDNLHSAYVDQWDWEKIITEEDRNTEYLKETVRSIVGALRDTQAFLRSVFPQLSVLPEIPEEITFVTTQELEDLYPGLTPKERENAFVKDHPVTFLMGIGGKLKSGKPHDGRAPDYDDWNLNGDLLCWDSVNGQVLHGHPGEPRVPGQAAHPGRLRRAPGAALPQDAAERPAPPHHGRRHRPVPAVHAAPGQGPYRRGAGVPVG